MKRKNRTFTKLENHNLEQRFVRDFQSGKYSICELARRYSVNRFKLLKWKHKHFGQGSMQQKRIFQMHLAQVPSRAIAEFFSVHVFHVHRAIRMERAKYAKKPQVTLF